MPGSGQIEAIARETGHRRWAYGLGVVLVIGVVVAIALLSGGSGSSDARQIRDAERAYLSASASQNWPAACAEMTHGLQRQLLRSFSSVGVQGMSCGEALNLTLKLAGTQDPQSLSALRKATISHLAISGARASMTVKEPVLGVAVTVPSEATRVAGRWLISCCVGPGPTSPGASTVGTPYPAGIVSGVLQACSKYRSSADCRCEVTYLEAHLSLAQLETNAAVARKVATAAVAQCSQAATTGSLVATSMCTEWRNASAGDKQAYANARKAGQSTARSWPGI